MGIKPMPHAYLVSISKVYTMTLTSWGNQPRGEALPKFSLEEAARGVGWRVL